MANKQYISIIRLFKYCEIPIGTDFNLPRVKKQLQAEFGIAKDGFIVVDGHNYTRHEVMEEIELPDFPKRLVFHNQIWNNPQILDWLENYSVDLNNIRSEFAPFWNKNEFDVFFSPYFVGPFSYSSRTLLGENRLEAMGDLMLYEGFLQAGEREEAFRPVRIFMEENARLLRNINGANYDLMRPKIIHWIQKDWFGFFNHLPSEFYETKNEIIADLINIGVAIQKTNRSDCKKMSEQLFSLQETPERLRDVIVTNHAVYMGESSKTGSWGSSWWIGFVIFGFIKMLASDGCGESKNDNLKFYQNDFKVTPSDYQMSDSLIKKLEKIGVKVPQDTQFKITPGENYK